MLEILNSLSVLLIFLGVFFDVLNNQFYNIEEKPNKEQKIKFNNYCKKIRYLIAKFIGILIFFVAIFTILIFDVIEVFLSFSNNFNFSLNSRINLIVVLIEICIFIFIIIIIMRIVSLYSLLKK